MKNKNLRFASVLSMAALALASLSAPVYAADPVAEENAEVSEGEITQPAPAAVDTSVMEISSEPSPDAILLTPSLVTISEIESTIALPDRAQLRESDEDPSNPKAAFSQDQLSRIFSDKPRFIYFPEGVDPMIIPWVREQIVAEELAAEAQIARTSKDFDKAEALWVQIREKYPNTQPGQEAPIRVEEIQKDREAEARRKLAEELSIRGVAENTGPDLEPKTEVVLPPWIRANTTAVLIEDNGGMTILLQNEFLKVGDSVPRFGAVVVKDIKPSEVTYTYLEKDFVVDVVGTF